MEDYQVIIIGGGVAGLTAGIYASRAQLKTILLEAMIPSGQAYLTELVENYPGFPEGISGKELVERMTQQALRFGLKIEQFTPVEGIETKGDRHLVFAGGKEFSAEAIIIATGAQWNKLGVPGEEEFVGKGISYCATCDGAFFKDQVVAVVGGGDTAIEEALYLSRVASKVYVIHRRDQLRAQKILQQRARQEPKISFVWNSVIKEVQGEGILSSLRLANIQDKNESILPVSGLFVAIGQRPNTEFLRGLLALDEKGYIITDESCATSIPGIFAAGDVRHKELRQIATAIADGAIAAVAAEHYIDNRG